VTDRKKWRILLNRPKPTAGCSARRRRRRRSFVGLPNSIRILDKTSLQTESYALTKKIKLITMSKQQK
jgi:hypothetical protein